MTTRHQISNATVSKRNRQYEIRYRMMTCNGKAISKVMGWCKGNLTNLRRRLHLSLAKGNPK
jgi:hypothetical protein